jgi:hypothetical protein
MNSIIDRGPFKGVSIAIEQVRLPSNEQDAYVFDTRTRTPYFLERFPPDDGWAVRVDIEPLAFDMLYVDHDGTTFVDGNGTPVRCPVALVKVRCANPAGITVGEASVLAQLGRPNDLASAETRARGRLYDALGLPTALDIASFRAKPTPQPLSTEDAAQAPATAATAVTPAATAPRSADSPMATVKAVPSSIRKDQRRGAGVTASQPEPAPATESESEALPAATTDEANAAPMEGETEISAAAEVAEVAVPTETPAPVAPEMTRVQPPLNGSLMARARMHAQMHKRDLPAFGSDAEIQAFLAKSA